MKLKLFSLLLVVVLLMSACAESGGSRRNHRDNSDNDRDDVITQEGTPSMQVQTIDLEKIYDNSKEYAVITGLDAQGVTVWEVKTARYDVAQLDSVTEIGLWEDRFYYVEGGTIVALDRETGETLWEVNRFQGYPAGKDACLIMEDGTIVATGYFGPDLTVVDKNGKLLAYLDTYDTNIFWPYEVVMEDGVIVITFEGSPEDTGETKLTVDPETWEVSE